MPARPPERRADLSSPAGPRRREPDDRLDRPGPAGGLSVYWRRCRRRRRRQAITWLQIIRPGSADAVEQVPLPPPPPLASARVPLRGEREGGRLTGGGGYGGGEGDSDATSRAGPNRGAISRRWRGEIIEFIVIINL